MPRSRKIGHDLKFDAIVLARHGVTLRGLETDTMIASYLLDATRSGAPPRGSRRSSTRSYKALTEEDVCGRGAKAVSLAALPPEAILTYAGERADLARPARAAARADCSPTEQLDGGLREPRAAADPRARRRSSGPACGSTPPRSPRSRSRSSRSWPRRSAQIYRARRRRVQHQLAEAAVRRPVRASCSCRRCKRTGKTGPSTAVDVLEELALTHELPRLILEWRGLHEAEGHLHRRAAAAGEPRDRPRAHVFQPGGRGHRPLEQQRPEPAEHPDPHRARARDPRARSSPSPATC